MSKRKISKKKMMKKYMSLKKERNVHTDMIKSKNKITNM